MNKYTGNIITTIKLITWYKNFIASDCELARIPGDDFHRTMTQTEAQKHLDDSLNRSINAGFPIQTYRDGDIALLRDKRRIQDIQQRRIRVYQFETRLVQRRFSHLLSNHNDS